jgi:hypothetical protein
MVPLETGQPGGKLLPHSHLWRRHHAVAVNSQKEDEEKHKVYHNSTTLGTWNVKTLNQGSKLKDLKKDTHKNAGSVLEATEVQWKGQGEISSADYTVYYSGGERAGRDTVAVVHKAQ